VAETETSIAKQDTKMKLLNMNKKYKNSICDLVSISSTFYSRYESALRSFSLVTVWHCTFWQKNIGAEAARKFW